MLPVCEHRFEKEHTVESYLDLFKGYSSLRAITFSVDMAVIEKLLRLGLKIKLIFGSPRTISKQHVDLLQSNNISAIEKNEYLVRAVANGALSVFLSKNESHEKLFVLNAESNIKTRVILGSANLSFRAMDGIQRENVIIMDDRKAFHYYSEYIDCIEHQNCEKVQYAKFNPPYPSKGHIIEKTIMEVAQEKIFNASCVPNAQKHLYIYGTDFVKRYDLDTFYETDRKYEYHRLKLASELTGAFAVVDDSPLYILNESGDIMRISNSSFDKDLYTAKRAINIVFQLTGEKIVFITQKAKAICLAVSDILVLGSKKVMKLDKDDNIVAAIPVTGETDNIMIAADNGRCVCFSSSEMKTVKPGAKGSSCMKLPNGVFVTSACTITRKDGPLFFVVSKKGFVKKICFDFTSSRCGKNRVGLSIRKGDLKAIIPAVGCSCLFVLSNDRRYFLCKSDSINQYQMNASGDMLLDTTRQQNRPFYIIDACSVPIKP